MAQGDLMAIPSWDSTWSEFECREDENRQLNIFQLQTLTMDDVIHNGICDDIFLEKEKCKLTLSSAPLGEEGGGGIGWYPQSQPQVFLCSEIKEYNWNAKSDLKLLGSGDLKLVLHVLTCN